MKRPPISEHEFLVEAERNRADKRESDRRARLDRRNRRLDFEKRIIDPETTLAPPPPASFELPQSLRPGTRRLTPKRLPAYSEQILSFHAPHVLPAFFRSLLTGVERNDPVYLKIAQEVYGYCQKNGVSITNNVNQSNNTATVSAGPSVDAVIRTLAEQKKRERQVITVEPVRQIEGTEIE